MPVDFKDIRIKSAFRTGNPTNFLLANIGEKITIEIDVEVSTYAIADNDNDILFNYTNGMIGPNWVYDPRGQFKNFNVGDVVEYKNYVTNGFGGTPAYSGVINVIDKLDDFHIQIDVDLFPGQIDQGGTQGIWNVKTPITGLKYKWNFIENDDALTFESKVDGTEQVALAPAISATAFQTSGALIVGVKYIISDFNAGDDFTNVGAASNATGIIFTATGTTPTTYSNGSTLNVVSDLTFIGAKTYQIGSASVYGNNINTASLYGFKFTIIHETVLTPFFLSAQWTDLLARIAPDYYFNTACLKSVFDIEAFFNYADPNRSVSGTSDELEGNTGWFDENFNTGVTNYSVDSIVYKDPSAVVIPGISLSTNETTVEITVKNTVDTPFSNNNTKFTLNFCKAPLNESEYQGNAKTLQENFLFDTALNTVGAASVDGDNYGTAYQVLKDVEATFVSSSEILITAKIAMDASIVADLNTLDEARYILFVATQNHLHDAPPPTVIDAVTLFVDAQEFYVDLTDPGMIVFANKYLRHYEEDVATEGTTSLEAYKEDEMVAYTQFYVDHTGRTTNTIQLTEITAKLKAKDSVTLAEFDLDEWHLPLSGLPYVAGDQYIDVTYPRPFHIPVAEIRKNIQLKRTPGQDVGLQSYYLLQFPFLIRWEYFLPLLTANYDFFDATEPNNGLNNDWFRYQDLLADWKVYYEVIIKAKKDGVPLIFNIEEQALLFDYDDKFVDFQFVSIKSYDPDSLTELLDPSGPTKFLLGYKNTLVKAVFSNLTNHPITLADVHFCVGIEVYEEGGVSGRRRISSVWTLDSDTWFLSTDGSGKVVKTLQTQVNPGDLIEASMYVDFSKIPLNKDYFKITARLYDGNSLSPLARVDEHDVDRFTEDSDLRIIEA